MNSIIKRTLSCLLALALVLSLCQAGIAPAAYATQNAVTSGNVALGKSVAFACGGEVTADSNYGVDAIKAGLSVLTDGISNSPNWWVNNGNPYVALKSSVVTGPYIFSVDLAASYVTEQVSVYSYGRPDWSVYPLEAVTYTISTDGSTWTTLGTVSLADAIKTTIEDPRYPGSMVDIYEFALPAEAAGRYVRATFNTNSSGLVGIGEFEVYGQKAPSLITTGATITYFGHGTEVGSDANWGSAAVDAGLSVLTDGIGNSPNWWVNNGNPNVGLKSSVLPGDYVFNLDIGGPSTISRISTYFYSRTDWGVDAPDAVTYSISTDGIKWTEVGSVAKSSATITALEDTRNPDAQAPSIYTFTLLFDSVDARYVKVTFGTNSLGLIGLQEIQAYGVKKTITNLALGRMANTGNYTYQVTGGGTGYEATGTTKADGTRYTVTEVEEASAIRLTDGTIINTSAVTYPSSWASQAWNSGSIMSKYLQIYRNDSRIITLDLGAVRNVTGIRMHFAAVESMGFYMPTNVTYYLSEDGENYYEVADVWNYQATSDSNDSNISCTGTTPRHVWYPASGISYNARYVKIIFPVNVYILSDELQVFGCEELSTSAPALDTCEKYDPLEKYVGHFANAAQTGGVRNEFMAYSGWYINSDGSEVYNTYKTIKEYMTSIAYIDENGVPQDWLFDDVTVMGHYYTSSGTFNSYKAGYTSGKYYADQDDWYEWLCYAFGKDVSGNDLSYDGNSIINLEALEEAARSAKETLNDPDYKVGVKLVLFPAVEYQEDWGYINGEHIDFTIAGCGSQETALANRAKAYQWYVDQAVDMWEQAGFEHLELTGFYYYEETIHESTDRIAKAATQALTEIVHTHATPSTNTKPAFDSLVGGHLYIYQLPFYQSEGYWNWAEYGFDYALMQPNYSFYDMYTLTQLKECADLCTYYGLGMQMEFGGTASTAYHEKFEDYLTYGVEYGYQSAVVSWYMSTWGCYSMAYNNNGTRYLYDMVYEFVQGQTIPECQHPEHNTDGRCTNCAAEVKHSYVEGACSACGAVCSHSYERAVTSQPGCETEGVLTYTCVDCGDSYTSVAEATGHSYVDGSCTTCGAADPDYVEPVTVPTLSLVAPSLNFEDEIYYNVYYTASDTTDVVEMGLITFDSYLAEGTVADALEVIPGYVTSGSNFMSHTNGIPSMKLGDALYFRVYAKLSDGTYAYSPTAAYHAVAYAKDILANSTNEKMKALVVAMLNYGAAAQVHFDYKTDALVNSFLTDEQKALVSEYSSDMVDGIVAADSSKTGNFKAVSGGYSALAPSVVFEGAFSINYYFTPAKAMDGELKLYYWKMDDYYAADVLTTENATGVVTMEETSVAGQYLGAVPEIAAKQIDQTVYVCGVYESDGVSYPTGVIAYSLGAYCQDRIANGTETMKAFATETVVYGYYAKQYFA